MTAGPSSIPRAPSFVSKVGKGQSKRINLRSSREIDFTQQQRRTDPLWYIFRPCEQAGGTEGIAEHQLVLRKRSFVTI